MAKKKKLRVYPDGDVWVVKKDGSTKASAIRNTQSEAWEAARNIALNQKLSVTIHGSDGKIQKTVTPRQVESNECFLTTACVQYFGLSDHCYQLTTLRKFRDGYLKSSPQNRLLIQQYYSIAPLLVDLLNADINKDKLFKIIYEKINVACYEIEKKRFSKAKATYTDTVLDLLKYFKLRKEWV